MIARLYNLKGKKLQKHYKDYFSDYLDWDQKSHAKDYLLFPENIGKYLSIDETSLSNGELYTIVTNKEAKGQKGSIVAIISGVKADYIIGILAKIPLSKRNIVQEITLDMANSMKLIAKQSFPKAAQVMDRFHVQKLAIDALQDIRIKHRWEAIDLENQKLAKAKKEGKAFTEKRFENGDSPKQLLARSRYLLFKSKDKWSQRQKVRAELLFGQYPDIKKAYELVHDLRLIFNQKIEKDVARLKLALWYQKVEKSEFKSFHILGRTIELNYEGILNFFNNRSTNASAESFNAKIKAFRAKFRGVKSIEFFLFRLTNIYA